MFFATTTTCGIDNDLEYIRISQRWSLSNTSQIRREGLCAHSVRGAMPGSHVRIMQCQKEMSEYWQHTRNGHLKNKLTGLCMDATSLKNGNYLVVNTCNSTLRGQQWAFANYSSTFVDT